MFIFRWHPPNLALHPIRARILQGLQKLTVRSVIRLKCALRDEPNLPVDLNLTENHSDFHSTQPLDAHFRRKVRCYLVRLRAVRMHIILKVHP